MKKANYSLVLLSLLSGCSLVYFINSRYGYSANQNGTRQLTKGGIFQIFGEENVEKGVVNEISYVNQKDTWNEYENKLSICDIGFAILSAPKYFDTRVKDLENSWLKHLCRVNKSGNTEHLSNYVLISSKNYPSIPTMIPNCDENYLNLCCKTLASFEWMLNNWPEKKWYMKLDDDTFIILSNLLEELSSINHNDYYLVGGQIYLTLEDSSVKPLSSRSNTLNWKDHGEVIKGIRGGAGYLMSKPLVNLFVKNGKRYLDICNDGGSRFKTFEDASLSLLVTELVGQKSILQIPGFHFHNPFVSYRSEYRNRGFKPITFHLMHDTSMMGFLDYLLNGEIRPSTYSCNHLSTNFCVSKFDLTISSKFWEPVFFGPLNSNDSSILGRNAILRNATIIRSGNSKFDSSFYFNLQNSIEEKEDQVDYFLNEQVSYIPRHKNTLEMSYPSYKYKNTKTPILDIININKQAEELKDGKIIRSIQMENNSPDKDHPCHDMIISYSNKLKDYYSKILFGTREVLFVGFPDHPNRGDSAIFTGALILLETLGIKIIKAIHLLDDYNNGEILNLFTVPFEQRAILFHGGGNFGDLYIHHHQLRYKILDDFGEYKVVMFPQTVFFKDQNKKLVTKENFLKHKGELFLAARDAPSLEILKEMFNDVSNNIEVKLLPDLAFIIGDQRKRRGIPSLDILIHARVDNEAPKINFNGVMVKMSKIAIDDIKKLLKNSYSNNLNKNKSRNQEIVTRNMWIDYLTIIIDDWLDSDANYNDMSGVNFIEKSISRTIDGMAFLSRANIVITNRLHGHILLTLLGIKHVVVADSFGKMKHFRDTWTSGCSLSAWHENFSDAIIRASNELSG
ncbi:galactosyltransferase [Cryptosporidium bovis]|uniref:galactosyltransferase n=1 Tax=Cryptosporidium bovis TaxID=310047 RepID=UPI00351A0F33|nr:galactosyltransferase [Cryptosporidium bovis]